MLPLPHCKGPMPPGRGHPTSCGYVSVQGYPQARRSSGPQPRFDSEVLRRNTPKPPQQPRTFRPRRRSLSDRSAEHRHKCRSSDCFVAHEGQRRTGAMPQSLADFDCVVQKRTVIKAHDALGKPTSVYDNEKALAHARTRILCAQYSSGSPARCECRSHRDATGRAPQESTHSQAKFVCRRPSRCSGRAGP